MIKKTDQEALVYVELLIPGVVVPGALDSIIGTVIPLSVQLSTEIGKLVSHRIARGKVLAVTYDAGQALLRLGLVEYVNHAGLRPQAFRLDDHGSGQ